MKKMEKKFIRVGPYILFQMHHLLETVFCDKQTDFLPSDQFADSIWLLGTFFLELKFRGIRPGTFVYL